MKEDQHNINPILYTRRLTVPVNIGSVPLGCGYPIRIQSMANTLTSDVRGSIAQCVRIIEAGADYVRFTVPSMSDVEAFAAIRQQLRDLGYSVPLIADVHFNPDIALKVADYADKVRINPGNFRDPLKFITLIDKCRKRKTAIRIGVNHGSLSEGIMNKYGDTPAGMAESAMEYLRLCRENNFDQAVVSMKASNVRVMVYATRLLVEMMDKEGMYFPLHLGVTEAGEGEDGRIKSAAGIGILLADGLGDTIRVSLTEDPEAEVPVARKLVNQIAAIAKPDGTTWKKGRVEFERRSTRLTGNIGGGLPPVVYGVDNFNATLNLITVSSQEMSDSIIQSLSNDHGSVLVYEAKHANVQAELRSLRSRLEESRCDVPVVFKFDPGEKNAEDFMLKSAISLGGAFIEGFGDGIWLTNSFPLDKEILNATALGILQACRARMSKTEYISCPSCGRTHFNLMEALARIKAATSHLKGLKIGVMGCIVNGPGEMADADYGYVGAGKGKVTLYKAKEVVKSGIPEENAVDELVALIKVSGDWVSPSGG